MVLLVIIPLFFFLLLYLVVFSGLHRLSIHDAIREALVTSVVIGSLLVVVITEFFSYFRLLRFDILVMVWMIMLSVIAFLARRFKVFNGVAGIKKIFKELKGSEKLIVQIMSVLLFISLVVALVYPVNNFDSQTYHMARVGYWEENQSISFYQTQILRQLELSPFAEWTILHLQILTGGDRFANALQLFFFACCISTVSLIAKSLGANRLQQLLSSLMVCFVPMAILESNTTQNDIVVSFYVLAFVYYTLKLKNTIRWILVFLSGTALGLTWLTKGSAYIFTAAFCCWYALIILKNFRLGIRKNIKLAGMYLLIPVIALAINSGQYYRNIFFSGTPLGLEGKGTAVTSFEIKPLIFVAIKNIMNNLPVTGSLKAGVSAAAIRVGLDPDDTRYNLSPISQMAQGFSFHEDYAQNVGHLILIMACLLLFFFRRRLYTALPRMYEVYVLSVLLSAFLFSVLLKWQPWSTRLMTPLFILFSVFIGMEIGRMKKIMGYMIALPIVIYGFVTLSLSSRHPILPFEKSIFSGRVSYDDFAYEDSLPALKQYLDTKPYKNIGIYIGRDSRDYMYYKLLRGSGDNKRLIKHFFVYDNKSKMYVDNFTPDAIISLEHRVEKYTTWNRTYTKTVSFGNFVLFEAK